MYDFHCSKRECCYINLFWHQLCSYCYSNWPSKVSRKHCAFGIFLAIWLLRHDDMNIDVFYIDTDSDFFLVFFFVTHFSF